MKKILTLFSFIFVAIFVSAFTQELPQVESNLSNSTEWNATLVGKFNGNDIDTLVCEPIGQVINDEVFGPLCYEWRVYTLNGTVEDLRIDNTVDIQFVNEGDLDNNGTDEWGFLVQQPTSSWTSYIVFTAIDGKWNLLIDPVYLWDDHIDPELNPDEAISLNDVVSTSDKKGYVKIRQSETNEDVTQYSIVDSLFLISPQKYSFSSLDW